MKKLFFWLFVFILILAVGIAVFIATFDADRYRPLIVEKLESLVGSKVELGRISLSFEGGLALKIEQLVIYSGAPGSGAKGIPAVELESASAVVDFWSLLRNALQATSLHLRGLRLDLIRNRAGEFRVLGIQLKNNPASQPKSHAILPFLIETIKLEDSQIRFTDQKSSPLLELTARDLDAALRNVSLTQPFRAEARMALAGTKQNLKISARVPLTAQGIQGLQDLNVEADLSAFDYAQLSRLIPALASYPGEEGPSGSLNVAIHRVEWGREGLRDLAGEMSLREGSLPLPFLGTRVDHLNLKARGTGDNFQIEDLSGQIARGGILLTGNVEGLTAQPRYSFQLKAEGLRLEALNPVSNTNEPNLKGLLSLAVQGTAEGRGWPVIAQTLSGEGKLILTEGVIMNLNILREVFQKLSMIPGLVEQLLSRLPETYKEKFSERDTVLEPIEAPFLLTQGALVFNPLRLATDSFLMSGAGTIRLDGALGAQAMVVVDPYLSEAMIRSVEELQYLTDREGRVQFPIHVGGKLPRVTVLPDLQYIATQLAAVKAGEWVQNLFGKRQSESAAPAAAPGAQAPVDGSQGAEAPVVGESVQETNPYQQLLGGLLQRALQKSESSSSSKT